MKVDMSIYEDAALVVAANLPLAKLKDPLTDVIERSLE